MPPVPTSFDVLVHRDRPALQAGFKPATVRIRQQRPGNGGFQPLAKSPQQFPGAIASVVATAQFLSQLRRQRQLGVLSGQPAIEARQLNVQQGLPASCR